MSQPKREVSYITPDSGRWEMLTSAEYVAKRGMVCPACQSSMLALDNKITGDNASCWQACKCDDCQYEWEDYYELTGYSPLEDQDE